MNSFQPHVTINLDESVSTFEFTLNGGVLTPAQALDFIEDVSKHDHKELWAYRLDYESNDLLIYNTAHNFCFLRYDSHKIYLAELMPFKLFTWLPSSVAANFIGRSESITIKYICGDTVNEKNLNQLLQVQVRV